MKRLTFLLASLFLFFGSMAQPGGLSYGATEPLKTPFVDGVYRALIIGKEMRLPDPTASQAAIKTLMKMSKEK